jgi:hypothetical protein
MLVPHPEEGMFNGALSFLPATQALRRIMPISRVQGPLNDRTRKSLAMEPAHQPNPIAFIFSIVLLGDSEGNDLPNILTFL